MQTAGRTARNVNGKVIMYADTVTGSMERMLSETNRRRKLQTQYNEEHSITPTTIYKSVEEVLKATAVADVKAKRDERREKASGALVAETIVRYLTSEQRQDLIEQLRREMLQAAKDLEFERAAQLRDEIERLQAMN
jgi:excinuclease ABC subunit B